MLSFSSRSALAVRRPVSVVDRINVLQEGHDGIQLLVGEVELRHAAAARNPLFRTCLDECLGAFFAVADNDVAQFRCEVGAFTHQGVATDAVMSLPELLALGDLRR